MERFDPLRLEKLDRHNLALKELATSSDAYYSVEYQADDGAWRTAQSARGLHDADAARRWCLHYYSQIPVAVWHYAYATRVVEHRAAVARVICTFPRPTT